MTHFLSLALVRLGCILLVLPLTYSMENDAEWLSASYNPFAKDSFFIVTTSTCMLPNISSSMLLCPHENPYLFSAASNDSNKNIHPIFGSEKFFDAIFVQRDKAYVVSSSCVAQMQFPFQYISPLWENCQDSTATSSRKYTAFATAPDPFSSTESFIFVVSNNSKWQVLHRKKVIYTDFTEKNISMISASSVVFWNSQQIKFLLLIAFTLDPTNQILQFTAIKTNYNGENVTSNDISSVSTLDMDSKSIFIDRDNELVSSTFVSTLTPQHVVIWILSTYLNVYQVHTPVHALLAREGNHTPWVEWRSTSASIFQYKCLLDFQSPISLGKLFWIPGKGMYTSFLRNLSILQITSYDLTFQHYFQNYVEYSQTCFFKNNPENTFNPCQQGEIFMSINSFPLTQISNQSHFCVKSPVGGFSLYSSFQSCPLGTVNINQNSISIDACRRCSYPLYAASSFQCLPCQLSSSFQNLEGTSCLSQCPEHQYQNFINRRCEPCMEGYAFSKTLQKCSPCPPNTYSTVGNPCTPCPPFTYSPAGSSFCSQSCDTTNGDCSPDGKLACARQPDDHTLSKSNLWTEHLFLNMETEMQQWNPTSMVVFKNSSFMIANMDSTLIEIHSSLRQENQLDSTSARSLGSKVKFSDFPFASYSIESITSMSLCPSESFLFMSDKTRGIILRIESWNATYPFSSIFYTMVNASMAPNHLCCTNQGLFFLDENSQLIHWIPEASLYTFILNTPPPYHLPSNFIHRSFKSLLIHCMTMDVSSQYLWIAFVTDNATSLLHIMNISLEALPQYTKTSTFLNDSSDFSTIQLSMQDATDIQQAHLFFKQKHQNHFIYARVNDYLLIIYHNIKNTTFKYPFTSTHAFEIVITFPDPFFFLVHTQPAGFFEDEELFFRLTPGSVNMVYKRAVCECDEDFYSFRTQTTKKMSCFQCPKGQHSMQGSRSCSPCPVGFYGKDLENCFPCPPLLWLDDPVYGSCKRVNSVSYYIPNALPPRLLMDLQLEIEPAKKMLKIFDIVSVSLFFSSYMKQKQVYTMLPDSDQLGYFWNFQSNLFSPASTQFHYPGLWFQCSPRVQVQQSCICNYFDLSLGHSFIQNQLNFWEQQRMRLSIFNSDNFTIHSLFAVRIHTDLSLNIPRLIKDASLPPYHFELSALSLSSDTGICMLGWPATYGCKDPSYFFDVLGSYGCERCPDGKFAINDYDLSCEFPTKQGPLCPPSTYRVLERGISTWSCRFCPPNTFSSQYMSTSCTKKLMMCPPDHYVLQTPSSRDNECEKCTVCPSESFMFPFFQNNPCDGTQLSKPYACINENFSIPNLFLNFQANRLEYLPCPEMRSTDPWKWAPGTFPQFCYFQCKYSVDSNAAHLYFQMFQENANLKRYWFTYNESQNLFPLPVPNDDLPWKSVCSPCDLSPCPTFIDPLTNLSVPMHRPIYTSGCGAPCLLNPEQCMKNTTHGCMPNCKLPSNSIFLGFGNASSENICLWRCQTGFFKHKSTSCVSCAAVQSLCPDLSVYRGLSSCFHDSSIDVMCVPCINNTNGSILLRDLSIQQKTCVYQCENEGVDYYKNTNPFTKQHTPCIRCTTPQRCPPGFRFQCNPNPCTPCSSVHIGLLGKYSFIASNSTRCKVICNHLYHTTYFGVLAYTPLDPRLDVGYFDNEVTCESCQYSMELCRSLVNCPSGQAIDISGEFCSPCKTSMEMNCHPGYYASPCVSGRVPQLFCVTCQTEQKLFFSTDLFLNYWPARRFLPYTLRALYRSIEYATRLLNLSPQNITSLNCPTACVANSIYVNGSCIPCRLLYPSTRVAPKSPYLRFYAVWNASSMTRWWDREYDPQHLGPRYYDPATNKLLPDSRINQCWPCPADDLSPELIHPESDQNFICASEVLARPNINIPKTSEIKESSTVFVYNVTSTNFIQLIDPSRNNFLKIFQVVSISLPTGPRRLLSDNQLFQTFVPLLDISTNTVETYNDSQIIVPFPSDFTHSYVSYQNYPFYKCQAGYYSLYLWSKVCFPCPVGFYCNGISKYACPISTTTLHTASVSFSDCISLHSQLSCMDGYSPITTKISAFCNPCSVGMYGSRNYCSFCPPYSISSLASTTCVCIQNTVPHFDSNGNLLACASNATHSPCTSSYAKHYYTTYFSCHHKDSQYPCKGRRSFYNDLSKRCECTPGTFFSTLEQDCKPCPRGFYSQNYGNAPCVPCLPGQTTHTMGSTSMQDCHQMF